VNHLYRQAVFYAVWFCKAAACVDFCGFDRLRPQPVVLGGNPQPLYGMHDAVVLLYLPINATPPPHCLEVEEVRFPYRQPSREKG
jgi:hypothetical protein